MIPIYLAFRTYENRDGEQVFYEAKTYLTEGHFWTNKKRYDKHRNIKTVYFKFDGTNYVPIQ